MAIVLLPDDPLPFVNMNTEPPSSPSATAIQAGLRRNDRVVLRQNGQQTPTPLVKGANLPSSSIPSSNVHQIST